MLLKLLRAITSRNTVAQPPNCVVNGIPMRLDAGEFIQRSMAEGVYEPIQTGWVRQHLHPGAVFVDVGASFGYFTSLAWSLVGARGRVFAFEPSPHAFAALTRNMGGPRFGNITLVNSAVGRTTDAPKRVEAEATEVLGQKKLLKWTVPGIAHVFAFWGFLVLGLKIGRAHV